MGEKTMIKSSPCKTSRSVLSFFLLDPDEDAAPKQSDCKWYNYPWKTDVFVRYLSDRNPNVYEGVIEMIAVFTFGTAQYRRSELLSWSKKYVLGDEGSNDAPFGRVL